MQVDSSCYSIPSKDSVSKWIESVPNGYVFHFKAFGMFCSQKCASNMLPRSVRTPQQHEYVRLSEMEPENVDRLWQAFHSCLQPAKEVLITGSMYSTPVLPCFAEMTRFPTSTGMQSNKLGCVLFQFHLSFTPSESNKRHVEWCRSRLDSSIDMAVEFRARAWFHPDATDTVVRHVAIYSHTISVFYAKSPC